MDSVSNNGISVITDAAHHKRYLQVDIDTVSTINDQELRSLIDDVINEIRKNQERSKQRPFSVSSLRGRMTPLTNDQIDQQFKDLRNEWEKNIL